MSSQILDWLNTFVTMEQVTKLAISIIIIAIVVIVERVLRSAISRTSNTFKLDTNLENTLKLIVRIVVFVIGTIMILQIFGLDADWLISISAVGGAAIGFASTQTIGNFLAGIYLMISRPFLVNDYVRIGEIEGEVKEITANYTKIYTPTFNIMEIPNRKVLDSVILNFSEGDVIDYTFQIGFPHDVPHRELVNECIIPAIDKFHDKYKEHLPIRPQFGISKMDRLGRQFSVRIHFPERNMDLFYNIQPELLGDIVNRWDRHKNKINKK